MVLEPGPVTWPDGMLDGTATTVGLPEPSNASTWLARVAAGGIRRIVSPGCPTSALCNLSQLSRSIATWSVSAWLRSRAATPRPSGNCDTRRGRRAPTMVTVPVWTWLNVSTASVIGRAMVPIEPDGDVSFHPNDGSVDSFG